MASPGIKSTKVLSSEATVAIINLESMWAQVDSIRTKINGECLHVRPENSFTMGEYCQRFNVPPSTAKDQLSNMVRRGMIKLVKVMLPTKAGSVAALNVYIPIAHSS